MTGFMVSKEVTYIGHKAIRARLGISASSLDRLIRDKKLLYYVVYAGARRSVRTNETMIRMTFLAWWQAALDIRRNSHTTAETAIREAIAVMPES